MLRRSLVALCSALVLAIVVLTVPVGARTASADPARGVVRPNRVTITDVIDDVWLWVPGDRTWTEAGPWPASDNVQAEATHWGSRVGDRVVVTMDFTDLQKFRSGRQEFAVKIATPRLTRVAWVIVKPGKWKGYHLLELSNGKAVSARGLTHQVGYTTETLTLTVPRSRLGYPPWVRVAFVNLMYTTEGGLFQDNPHDASYLLAKTWKKHPPLSARLFPVVPSRSPATS